MFHHAVPRVGTRGVAAAVSLATCAITLAGCGSSAPAPGPSPAPMSGATQAGPVAVVAMASRDDETVLRGTLSTIAALVADAGVRRTAVIIVGRVLTAEHFPDSHLYSSARAR